MSCVISTLISCNYFRMLRKKISDFTFPSSPHCVPTTTTEDIIKAPPQFSNDLFKQYNCTKTEKVNQKRTFLPKTFSFVRIIFSHYESLIFSIKRNTSYYKKCVSFYTIVMPAAHVHLRSDVLS